MHHKSGMQTPRHLMREYFAFLLVSGGRGSVRIYSFFLSFSYIHDSSTRPNCQNAELSDNMDVLHRCHLAFCTASSTAFMMATLLRVAPETTSTFVD